jgi:hypothetical protein
VRRCKAQQPILSRDLMYMNVDLNYWPFHFGLPLAEMSEAPFTTAKLCNILLLNNCCQEAKTFHLFSCL